MTDFDVAAVDLSGILNQPAEEKAKQLQAKRDFVERKYRSQFAAQDEAEKWNTVPLRRFFG